MSDTVIVRVALNVPLYSLFDYISHIPEVEIGQLVSVPWGKGNRHQVGIVVDLPTVSDIESHQLKTIHAVLADVSPLDSHIIHLARTVANYYLAPLGAVLLSTLPSRLRHFTRTKLIASPPRAYRITAIGLAQLSTLPKQKKVLSKLLGQLATHGVLSTQALYALSPSAKKNLAYLVDEHWIEPVSSAEHKPESHALSAMSLPTLNSEQSQVIAAISAHQHAFRAWLLHGITGSGKTEVYMRLIECILATSPSQVLVLVPEINLTPQLENHFRQRFSAHLCVVLHSRLSEHERFRNWQLAQQAQIVIGTRLAVLTPMPHLRLIVVDEEHDNSYKQQEGIHYHARDVALLRAKQLNIPIILGSATPALNSWYNIGKKYHLLQLTQRAVAQARLPHIYCVDLNTQPMQHGLTPTLLQALQSRLARQEQSLLFINRRGFSPVLLCLACRWIAPCYRCNSRLVMHLQEQMLRCHHCGYEQNIPKVCPSCHAAQLRPSGYGTQRITETIQHLLPQARIIRVDGDSMRQKGVLAATLKKIQQQEVDILIGTQILAKGHDFAHLTLVGVLDADHALHSADYRASEQHFAQLMQVSGRVGRGQKAGEVIIQTYYSQHPLFRAVCQQDYVAYAQVLLKERQIANLPPYVFHALLRAQAKNYAQVEVFLTQALHFLEQLDKPVVAYPPTRPIMARINHWERGHMFIESRSRTALQQVLWQLHTEIDSWPLAKKLRWSIDVDSLES